MLLTPPLRRGLPLCILLALTACGTATPNNAGVFLPLDAGDSDSNILDSTDSGAKNDGAGTSQADADGATLDTADVQADTAGTTDVGPANDIATKDTAATPDTGPATGCTPACSLSQLCVSGACQAVATPCSGACMVGTYCDTSSGTHQCKTSTCTLPTTFGADVQKVSYMQIAVPSQGCDMNDDGKPDNVFGKLLKVYPAANTELLKSIQNGLFVLLLEADSWKTDGSKFAINGYLGAFDSSNPTCSPTSPASNCKYTVNDSNFGAGATGICPTQVRIEPATVNSGQLLAGGQIGQTLTIKLPVVGGLKVTLRAAKLDGAVAANQSWNSTKKGRICGVITQADFDKAIDAVDAAAWKQIQLEKSVVKQVLATFLAPDIDLNKDGVADAISVALLFETVRGQITKVTF